MGTSYFLWDHFPSRELSPEPKRWHIGHSSEGWCFALHVIPDVGINDLDDWIILFKSPTARIENEYQDSVTRTEMLSVIRDRVWTGDPRGSALQVARGRIALGPGNLLRTVVDGEHCIGHGEGTWDLRIGEFS